MLPKILCIHHLLLFLQHNRTQLQVHTPLNALLLQFKGPQSLIEKRFDKLLDYENSQKSSDPKDKTQVCMT